MENPYSSPAPPAAQKPDEPANIRQAAWRGARSGLKWTTYTFGAVWVMLFAVCLFMDVAFVALGHWKIPEALELLGAQTLQAIGGFLVACLWGVPLGVLCGLIRYAIRRRRK